MTPREEIEFRWAPKWTVTCPRGRQATLLSLAVWEAGGCAHWHPEGFGRHLTDPQLEFIIQHLDNEAFGAKLAEQDQAFNRVLFWGVDRAVFADGFALQAVGKKNKEVEDFVDPDDLGDLLNPGAAGDIAIVTQMVQMTSCAVNFVASFGMGDWSPAQSVQAGSDAISLGPAHGAVFAEILSQDGEYALGFRRGKPSTKEFIVEHSDPDSPFGFGRMSSLLLNNVFDIGKGLAWKFPQESAQVRWSTLAARGLSTTFALQKKKRFGFL